MQIIIVFIILSLSLCYIGYRVYKSFSGGGDPCKGCNGCAIKANQEACIHREKCEKDALFSQLGKEPVYLDKRHTF